MPMCKIKEYVTYNLCDDKFNDVSSLVQDIEEGYQGYGYSYLGAIDFFEEPENQQYLEEYYFQDDLKRYKEISKILDDNNVNLYDQWDNLGTQKRFQKDHNDIVEEFNNVFNHLKYILDYSIKDVAEQELQERFGMDYDEARDYLNHEPSYGSLY